MIQEEKCVAEFDKLTDPNATMEELLQLACRFDPEFFRNISANEKNQELRFLDFFNNEIQNIRAEIDGFEQEGSYIDFKSLSGIFFCEK